jgi:hypothetical protein
MEVTKKSAVPQLIGIAHKMVLPPVVSVLGAARGVVQEGVRVCGSGFMKNFAISIPVCQFFLFQPGVPPGSDACTRFRPFYLLSR